MAEEGDETSSTSESDYVVPTAIARVSVVPKHSLSNTNGNSFYTNYHYGNRNSYNSQRERSTSRARTSNSQARTSNSQARTSNSQKRSASKDNSKDTNCNSLVQALKQEKRDVNAGRESWRAKYSRVGIKSANWNSRTSCIKKLHTMMNSTWFLTLSILWTFYALYMDDLRIIFLDKTQDEYILYMHIICTLFFIYEIIVLSLCERNFFCSFYMILDTLATASLILDIVALLIMTGVIEGNDGNQNSGYLGNFRAARAARVGTRVGRIIRALRLMRSFKKFSNNDDKSSMDYDVQYELERKRKEEKSTEMEEEEKEGGGFRFGGYLNYQLTKKVICCCLSLVIIIPLLESEYSLELKDLISVRVQRLSKCLNPNERHCLTDASRMREVKSFVYHYSPYATDWFPADQEMFGMDEANANTRIYDLIKLSHGNAIMSKTIFNGQEELVNQEYFDSIRKSDQIPFSFGEGQQEVIAHFGQVNNDKNFALCGILQTTFLLLVLVSGITLMGNDMKKLVVNPVKNMLKDVQKLAHDPFYFWEMYDHGQTKSTAAEEEESSVAPEISDEQSSDFEGKTVWNDGLPPEHEIVALQNTVVKISQLLALGFGRAGWNIIRKTVSGGLNKIDFIRSGTRMNGIFMFSDIRNFTDITECLDKNVTVFVNDIAEIVHSMTVQYQGATNKNVGDAFLSAWTFPKKVTVKGKLVVMKKIEDYKFEDHIPIQLSDLTLRGLICTIKIYLQINRSPTLAKYSQHPFIMQRFPNGYYPALGIGLHTGWAIEGLLGTKHKIDVTYVSTHVNIAMELESKTKKYKVPILLSQQLVIFLPEEARRLCRPVDVVTFKSTPGGKRRNLYTLDLPPPDKVRTTKKPRCPSGHHNASIREWRAIYTNCQSQLNSDPDIKYIIQYQQTIEKFTEKYMEGFGFYAEGDWKEALAVFKEARVLKPDDGPNLRLIDYIESLNVTPPDEWLERGCWT